MSEKLIVVGTPSYNEEDRISRVVTAADKGLQRYFPDDSAVLVDVDQSDDETRQRFLATDTQTPKEYFRPGPEIGKGRSLISLLEFATERSEEFDQLCVVTIDADVTSARPEWIQKLVTPVLEGSANFVTANYRRNRYEGNTTNHFCYPILAAIYGCDLRQPIAGDFSMDRKACETFLSAPKIPPVYRYGIDYFFSLNAVHEGLNIEEAMLGRKVHAPSFGKMVPMFEQIASTTFYVLSENDPAGARRNLDATADTRAIGEFVDRPSRDSVRERMETTTDLLTELSDSDPGRTEPISPEYFRRKSEERTLESREWCDVLSDLLEYIRKNEITTREAERLAEVVTPLYLLRVLSYFDEIEGADPDEVERSIETERDTLRELVSG